MRDNGRAYTEAQLLTSLVAVDGATGGFAKDSDFDWTSYTPTVTAVAGTITSVTGQVGRYCQVGKLVFHYAVAQITTNGTGSGALRFTLPSGPGNVTSQRGFGIGQNASTGLSLVGHYTQNQQYVDIQNYDGTYPAADGQFVFINGFYRVA